jgi:hypothetical protein
LARSGSAPTEGGWGQDGKGDDPIAEPGSFALDPGAQEVVLGDHLGEAIGRIPGPLLSFG